MSHATPDFMKPETLPNTTDANRVGSGPLVRPGPATHIHIQPIRLTLGGWEYETQRRSVRVMAVAEGYAMVRLKGAMPYVCSIKEIEMPNTKDEPRR